MTLRIDCYNHMLPRPFFDRLGEVIANRGAIKRWLNIPFLHDLDRRFAMLEQFGPDYRQVLSLSAPPIEAINPDRQITLDMARLANDELAAVVARHPDRFPGFIAALPLNHPQAATEEATRAARDLGALGVQMFTNVNGLPLDDPRFLPLFDRLAALDMPIFLHPVRGANVPDYAGEDGSRYEIWWTFGWPYETSVAMQRLVFSGLFARLPGLRIVTHHLGAMIPYFEGRIGYGLDQFGSRTPGTAYEEMLAALPERPVDTFRRFWADTATFGSRAALVCGLEFFGTRQVVFASDAPFDPEGGTLYIRKTMAAIDTLDLSAQDRHAIYQGNAERLFGRALGLG